MGVFASPEIVNDGLVLALDAGNPKSYPGSGTTWTDLILNSNTGTLVGGPSYGSTSGGSIVFDGTNDNVSIGTNGFSFGSSPGTLSAWAKTRDRTSTGTIVSYGNSTTNQARFLGIGQSNFYFSGYGSSISASGLSYDTWFNLVGVYDGTNASMYVNGALVSGPTARSWNTIASNAGIGKNVNNNEYWQGDVAQVQIYNKALSAAEIQQNYNAFKSRYATYISGEEPTIVPSQVQYTSPGTYSWTCPSGVYSVSAAVISGGGGGGVTQGDGTAGGDSYFISSSVLYAYGGGAGPFGAQSGDVGGAGGYMLAGDGSISGAAGPTKITTNLASGGGRAGALLSQHLGSSGTEGIWVGRGGYGAIISSNAVGGAPGTVTNDSSAGSGAGFGGTYGGGGGGGRDANGGGGGAVAWKNNIAVVPGQSYTVVVGSGGLGRVGGTYSDGRKGSNGAGGAVRIIWGTGRSYPSTNITSV